MKMSIKFALLACAIAGVSACGGAGEEASAGETPQETAIPAEGVAAAPDAAAPVSAAAPATPADAPLSVGDIDAYVLGMRKEIALLEATVAKVEQAKQQKDEEAQASAVMEAAMADRDAPAATAAGLPVERWKQVKSRIAAIIGGVAMRAQLSRMGGEAADMTAEQKAEQEKNVAAMLADMPDPYQGLEPAVVDALESRHDELAALHAESVGLLLKAASR